MHARRITVAAIVAVSACGAGSAPFTPKDDTQVLERLPARPSDPAMAELRRLRAALAARPNDSAIAAELAERYFELSSGEGDPRYVGYAEAALRPWRGTDAPAEILFMRGLLRQYRHDFEGGLRDLELALKSDPGHIGARSWRAAIFMVRADYPAAGRECAALAQIATELRAAGCAAYLDATTGRTRAAYARLSDALRRYPEASPAAKLWALTRLAEMASRLEDHAAADRLFNQALALGVDDNFLLAAYADYLLERGRPKEVVGLLKSWARSDTLLLRLALAERALGMREATAHAQTLADRFAAAALRGERLHMGEESRFLLELQGETREALAVALENWKEQREPRDAAAVLAAAAAARDAKAAEPVLRWLRESGFESESLKRLAASLK
jgi:Tfp pilus assembly protein PilF